MKGRLAYLVVAAVLIGALALVVSEREGLATPKKLPKGASFSSRSVRHQEKIGRMIIKPAQGAYAAPWAIGPSEAYDAAIETLPAGSSADAVAVYGLFTDPSMYTLISEEQPGPLEIEDVPAWVVIFPDACIPLSGPAGQPPVDPCGRDWNVVVEAATGRALLEFSG